MQYWLVKSEPEAYSWEQLMKDGKVVWDGVRNYQARNNLKAMELGDKVLIYHSVSSRQVVGIAKVTCAFFPDPTTDDPRWVAVELVPEKPLSRPVTLEAIKKNPKLEDIALIKQSRLSVMPLTKDEFDTIIKMGS